MGLLAARRNGRQVAVVDAGAPTPSAPRRQVRRRWATGEQGGSTRYSTRSGSCRKKLGSTPEQGDLTGRHGPGRFTDAVKMGGDVVGAGDGLDDALTNV